MEVFKIIIATALEAYQSFYSYNSYSSGILNKTNAQAIPPQRYMAYSYTYAEFQLCNHIFIIIEAYDVRLYMEHLYQLSSL